MLSYKINRSFICLLFCVQCLWAQNFPSRNYSAANELPNNAVRTLFVDSNNVLWIGTENGIVSKQNNIFQSYFEEDGLALNMILADTDETAYLFVSGGALHHRMGVTDDDAPTLTLARADFDRIPLKQTNMAKLLLSLKAKISGNPLKVRAFFAQIEEPPFWFEIIRP